jgi:hypothetical protein
MSTVGLFAISMSETAYRGLERRNERRGQTEQRIKRQSREHDESLAPADGNCSYERARRTPGRKASVGIWRTWPLPFAGV